MNASRRGSDEKGNARQEAAKEREAERRRRIAIEAYYNAERRGFGEGAELDDWLEAERRIDSQASDKETAAHPPDDGAFGLLGGDTAAGEPLSADQPGSPGAHPGAERIEPDQVKKWARELNVSAPQLREAIKRVGSVVRDVKEFLESSPPPAR
jgi:hypothetical protein